MADTQTSPSTDTGPSTQWSLEAQPDAGSAETFEPDRSWTGPLIRSPDTRPDPEPKPAPPPSAPPEALDAVPEREPIPAPVAPIVVPGAYQFLKRWHLAAVLFAVWIPAAAVGAGLYHWWFTSFDKTLPVFAVLVFVVICTVAALLVSLVPDRPMAAAVAVAMMTAVAAAVVAAALLHGAYFFEWIERPEMSPPG